MTVVSNSNKQQQFTQSELYHLSRAIYIKLNNLIQLWDIELVNTQLMRYGSCPIHDGDNKNAFNIYNSGVWKCRSHQCHKTFTSSMVGFVRGLLSHKHKNWTDTTNDKVSLVDTVQYIQQELNLSIANAEEESKKFAASEQIIYNIDKFSLQHYQKKLFTRNQILNSLDIPAKPFLGKYTPEILEKYDVGLCTIRNKKMFNRVVLPIYDDKYEYGVGCTGRTIYSKCEKCNQYHCINNSCKTIHKHYCKWLSIGLDEKKYLFNYWFAQPSIKKNRSACLVESPGNTLKLVQNGIPNCLGIFGTNVSQTQYNSIVKSGALYLNILMDNDKGGETATKNIIDQFGLVMNINVIKLDKRYNDVSDAPDEYVKTLKNQIKTYII